MATAINGSGLNVQATVVNVGSSASPDYRLAVQGTKLGPLEISLKDDEASPSNQELLHTQAEGELASYQVNGYDTPVTSNSRTVDLAPGVTVTLTGNSGEGGTTTISVSRSTASLKDALASFVSAYNAAVSEVNTNRGEGGGALTGNSVIQRISQSLAEIQSYSPGSGPFSSLEDIGVKIDKTGVLTFDPATFDTAAAGNLDQLGQFLGTTTTGGFLKVATSAINQLEDPDTGALTSTVNLLDFPDELPGRPDLRRAGPDRSDADQPRETDGRRRCRYCRARAAGYLHHEFVRLNEYKLRYGQPGMKPAPPSSELSPEEARARLTEAAAGLREAVTQGRYADAKELLSSYSGLVAATASPETAEAAKEFIEWARRLILARRSILAGQLRQISTPRSYLCSAPAHTLDLSG